MMRRLCFALTVAAVSSVTLAAPAGAANTGASCLGVGSSANAGYPRDRAVISHDVKVVADVLGLVPGTLISEAARRHEGSPQACFGE